MDRRAFLKATGGVTAGVGTATVVPGGSQQQSAPLWATLGETLTRGGMDTAVAVHGGGYRMGETALGGDTALYRCLSGGSEPGDVVR